MASNGKAPDPGGGDIFGKKSSKKFVEVEEIYQKKSQLEHILLRPDTYIGSVEHVKENMWVLNLETNTMVLRDINYVPGLYKIFDEILVNAADNKQRDPTMNSIKIEINPEKNIISVWNNGTGIPVVEHKDEKMYVPTMIFGHLLTSSNYNDEEEKVTGGRNGYGAKLCNIFSNKFTVETASSQYRKIFKQTWSKNMATASDPQVRDYQGSDYTKVVFSPDLAKFKMEKLDDDIVDLMSRRAFDCAATTKGVSVYLNGTKIPIKGFKDYVQMYLKNKTDDNDAPLTIVHEIVNERWEVAVTTSTEGKGFLQVSFVNSIATTKGGRHVDHIVDALVKELTEIVKKKNKGGPPVRPFTIKSNLWVFVNCLIVNPTFDSQTKENMTLMVKNFGSKCTLTPAFLSKVAKCGVVDLVLRWALFKAKSQLNKVGGSKKNKISGLPKLEDANDAGTRASLDCTLILTEGDSAKTLAVSGLGIIGRDKYGVFPLRGKLLNVRDAPHKQLMENVEINAIIKIMGLQYKRQYTTEEDLRSLRYGKLMIMTDQDQDGSHIKGLLINFLHANWPSLLKIPFLEQFITPIVKVTKGKECLSFYSLPEFEEWKASKENWSSYSVKYYKGLGTSTSKEAKEYFSDMKRHRIVFNYSGDNDDFHIKLAFSKQCVEQRKEWLTEWMDETKRRRDLGLVEDYLYQKNTQTVNYTDFVNKELVLFSYSDNERSIPNMVDGLKPGQRKVLFTCLKRNDKKEVKVAQLAGSVGEKSAYHHGEASLMSTIIVLAQNYVGSNNINLLQPIGQFGTRLSGGKDVASPRYIFTKLSSLTKLIFHPADEPLLKPQYDDGMKIEPVWYIPIIPMVLVNGADGIGTGWMTKIPNYDPRQIVRNIRLMIDGKEIEPMIPFYKNFKGTIEPITEQRYMIYGVVSVIDDEEGKVEITELPIGVWTQNYKENVLLPMANSDKGTPIIQDMKEYNTDISVRFLIQMSPTKLRDIERGEGLHQFFKIQSSTTTTSMCAFDQNLCMKRYNAVEEILREFFTLRLSYYDKRKAYLEGMLQAEALKLTNQARFIIEKCDNTLVIENKKKKLMIDELVKRGYDQDPVKSWKKRESKDNIEEEEEAEMSQDDELNVVANNYDYLLGMPMWSLTLERKNEIIKKRDEKKQELSLLQAKSGPDLWSDDLDVFLAELDKVEELEKLDDQASKSMVLKSKQTSGKRGAAARKSNVMDTFPAQDSRTVEPKTEELIKKYTKVKRVKKVKGSEPEEKDEFDLMGEKPMKSLHERLGDSPASIEKKMQAKKKEKPEKTISKNMKQTTLNFKSKSPKKKKSGDDSDESFYDDVSEVISSRPTSKRSAVSKVKYSIGDSDDDEDSFSDEPRANDLKRTKYNSDDSDYEILPSKKVSKQLNESSDAMFDSLIKNEVSPVKSIAHSVVDIISDESSSSPVKVKSPPKKSTKKAPAALPKKVVKKATKPVSKHIYNVDSDDSGSDDFFQKPSTKKSKKDSTGSTSDNEVKVTRPGRARKPVKYGVDSDSE